MVDDGVMQQPVLRLQQASALARLRHDAVVSQLHSCCSAARSFLLALGSPVQVLRACCRDTALLRPSNHPALSSL